MNSKKIVIATFGSLGDVYPYIAIARVLAERGHDVTIATSKEHHNLVVMHGVNYAPAGPHMLDFIQQHPDVMAKIMDTDTGSEFVLREVIMKNLRASYDDFYAATEGADLLITQTLTYAAILAARKRKVPFIATVLSPLNFWSKYDPPAMAKTQWLPALHKFFGPAFSRLIIERMHKHIYDWGEPYRELQKDLGLEPMDTRNVFFEGMFSPTKNFGLFSPIFGPPQPDWPPNTVATGFPFLDVEHMAEDTRQAVRSFLQDGDAPVVFTLGSSAVWDAGDFYIKSVEAVKQLNIRAVLLTGSSPDVRVPKELPGNIIAVDYLPHSLIFRHASAIVHQGGVGTTAQALRSGRPQLIMPFSHDQFDNAARVKRLGCGLSANRHRHTVDSTVMQLRQVLSGRFQAAAATVARQMESENGAEKAADEVVEVLNRS